MDHPEFERDVVTRSIFAGSIAGRKTGARP